MFNTFYIDPYSDLKILSEPSGGYLDYFKVETSLKMEDIKSIFQDYLAFRKFLGEAHYGCCANKSYEQVVLGYLQFRDLLTFTLVEPFPD